MQKLTSKCQKIIDCRWADSLPTSSNSFRITLREELKLLLYESLPAYIRAASSTLRSKAGLSAYTQAASFTSRSKLDLRPSSRRISS